MAYRDTSIEGRLLAGDSRALARVVRWIAVVIMSPRFRGLGDERIDVHQDVLARIIRSLRMGRFDPAREFRNYVQAVARYAAQEALRHRHGEGEIVAIGDDFPDDALPFEDQVAAVDLARRVIACASEECRRLMRAYFHEQRSYAEIAREMGLPVGTVKSRLFRCLENAHRSIGGRRSELGSGGRHGRSPQRKDA